MATMTTTTASFEPPVPQEMAIPGTHASVMRLVTRTVPPSKGIRVLDVGASQGPLSLKLLEAGYDKIADAPADYLPLIEKVVEDILDGLKSTRR